MGLVEAPVARDLFATSRTDRNDEFLRMFRGYRREVNAGTVNTGLAGC